MKFWIPRYKWQLLAWFSQNGIDVPAKAKKRQLYAIYYGIRRGYENKYGK